MNVRSKLDRWCEGVLEGGWLAALIVAPMFFNVFSSRVFEPDKASLVRTIALLMLATWLVKVVNGGPAWLPAHTKAAGSDTHQDAQWSGFWRNPLFIPVLLLIVAYLLSNVFSLARFVSWFGSYQRLQGVYTFLSYVAIAGLTAAHLRRPEQVRRLQHVIVVTSLPIAVYGVIQHYKQDPLPWGGDVTTRVAANAGNAIFLAAYLIFAFFFTVERIWSSFAALMRVRSDDEETRDIPTALAGGAYLFIAMVQLLAIVWTQSRGPWLGLLAGSYLFFLLVFVALRPTGYRVFTSAWVGLGVLGVIVLVLMNTTALFNALRPVPYLGRLTTVLDRESQTAQVRTLIWQGAANLVTPHQPLTYPDGSTDAVNAIRPLVGYGPEAMWVAYNNFYPPNLAHVEARNASPDRSHNETWDSLVITGIFGFVAYLAVFTSIFYWALRWLGLIVNRRDNLLFGLLLGLGSIGAAVGFSIYDGLQLRYFGVAFPAGLIAGFILYVMIAVFLHPNLQIERANVQRQLLIITVLSAIVAHFVEIHFGIAIVSTRTYFWILTALMLTLGMRLSQPESLTVMFEPLEPAPVEPSAVEVQAAGKKRRSAPPPRPVVRVRQAEALSWLPSTVMTDLLTFLVAVFIYTTNSQGAQNAFDVFINSVTVRIQANQPVSSPSILLLLFFTWLVSATVGLVAESLRQRRAPSLGWWLRSYALHAMVVWGGWLVYGLVQGSRLTPLSIPAGLSANDQLNFQLDHVANHFAVFTAVLVLWILAAGVVYAWPWLRDRRLAVAGRPVLSLVAATAGAIVVFALVNTVNVQLVRADIIYKQGQQFDGQRNWVDSIELYRRALASRATEDHYMLFLGRALLEQAKLVQNMQGTAGFPANPTLDDVLNLRPETIRLLGREDLLLAAETVLEDAQRVNPLNTDHTANLARLYRTWADLTTDNAALRQTLLDKSVAMYDVAVTLSPNAAHLWNEKGNAFLALGQSEQAEAAYLKSLSLDQIYDQTYLLLADFYERGGDQNKIIDLIEQGIQAYEAADRTAPPSLYSYLGVAQARLGDLAGAASSNETILSQQPTNVGAMRNLALIYRDQTRLPEAAAMIEQALALTPADRTAELQQLRSVALDIYLKLAGEGNTNYLYPLNLARLLQQEGNLEAARQYAQQALDLSPESARFTMTQFLQSLGGS